MSTCPDWPISPDHLPLHAGRIDIWAVNLPEPQHPIDWYRDCLVRSEIKRANRYRIAAKRQEFVVTRGLTRRLLARFIGCQPIEVALTFGRHGKPVLEDIPLAFNVSHSHDLALIAIAKGGDIGIDVEQLRNRVSYMRLAKRFFSPAERDALLELPVDDQQLGFFACWTRKEALLKADGSGIARGLDTFDVTVDPALPAELLATRWPQTAHTSWRLADIDVGPYYRAAIASSEPIDELRLWRA